MEHFKDVGAPDKYCGKCQIFYSARPNNECRVEGCQSHMKCHICEQCQDERSDYPFDEVEDHYETQEYPSKTGYLECWICKASFCNNDFVEHYESCRNEAANIAAFDRLQVKIRVKSTFAFPAIAARNWRRKKQLYAILRMRLAALSVAMIVSAFVGCKPRAKTADLWRNILSVVELDANCVPALNDALVIVVGGKSRICVSN